MKCKFLLTIASGLLLLIHACNTKEKDVAGISPEKMQAILIDLHLAEYYSQGLGSQQGSFVKNFDSLLVFYASIFQKHQVDIETFKENIVWYQAHPIQFDTIYLRSITVVDSLRALYKEKQPDNDSTTTSNDTVPKSAPSFKEEI